jgi:transposase
MDTQSVHKTYKYRLYPTPAQERALETILWRFRVLYNTALEARNTAWERRGFSLNPYHQANKLPDLKAACPEYGEVHSQVLQDVLQRVERAYQGFFRRIRDRGQPGHSRYKSRNRYRSVTYPQYGATLTRRWRDTGATLARRWMMGYSRSLELAASRSCCICPWRAYPRLSRSGEKPMAGTWRSPAPTRQAIHRAPPGKRPALTWG